MTETARALQSFFSGFGIPAYPENAEPDRAKLPCITYLKVSPNWRASAPIHARVWYRSRGFEEIDAKVDQISAAIGEGVSIPTDSGCVWLFQEDNFHQYQENAGDPDLKCAYLSMSIHALTN